QRPSTSTLFPYTTLFRSQCVSRALGQYLVRARPLLCRQAPPRAKVRARKAPRARSEPRVRRHSVRFGGDETIRVLPSRRIRKGRSEEHTSELQSRGHLVC